MPSVRVGGLDIHYRIDGQGPWVTLSHSLTTDLTMWDGLAAALAETHTVLRYDTRGHGATGAPEGAYTFAQLVDDVLGLWGALGIERSDFIGISMGGMIAQHLALAAPGRIGKLVVVSSSSRMAPEMQSVWQQRIDDARAQGIAALAPATLQRWFTRPYRQAHPELMQRIGELIAATPVAGYVGCAEAIRNLNVTDRLPTIEAPTLVVVGADDPGTPPAVSQVIADAIPGARLEIIADAIPGARLEIIADASHLCCIEQAEAFNRLVAGFLG